MTLLLVQRWSCFEDPLHFFTVQRVPLKPKAAQLRHLLQALLELTTSVLNALGECIAAFISYTIVVLCESAINGFAYTI